MPKQHGPEAQNRSALAQRPLSRYLWASGRLVRSKNLFCGAQLHPHLPLPAPATPALTPAETAACDAFTASPLSMSPILTLTSTLLNAIGIAFGTIIKSLQDVPMSGATKPN